MLHTFKAFLLLSMLIMLSFSHADVSNPRFLAVSFHADWCSSCKALAPKISKARTKAHLDQTDVLFVKLDLTDENTSYQAGMLAESLGLGELFKHNNGKTGYIAVVEASTGIILSKITKNATVDEMVVLLDLDK